MLYEWHDLVGNAGVVMILATYGLLQAGRMQVSDLSYSLWNGLGAGLIIVSLCFNFNLSSFVIELVWLALSIFGLCRSWRGAHPGGRDEPDTRQQGP